MLKNHWRLVSRIARIGDIILVISSFFLAYQLRDPFVYRAGSYFSVGSENSEPFQVLGPIQEYLIVLGLGIPFYSAFLSLLGAYRSMRFGSLWNLLRFSSLSSMLVFGSLATVLFLLKLDLSRSFVGLFCAFSGILIFIERTAILAGLRVLRERGKNFRNLLIAGTGEQAQKFVREVLKYPELGIRVVGYTALQSDEFAEHPQAIGAIPVVATSDTFERALKAFAVDEVVFTDIVSHYNCIEEMVQIAAEEGIRVTLAADLFSLELVKSDISYFGSIPLIHYESSPLGGGSSSLLAKRSIDAVVAASLLAVLSPLLALVALLIKLESDGPVFFRQRRIGLNGRQFVLLKFRSMIDNAEQMRTALEARNEMTGPVFKIKDDPRVTHVGRWLRRFSIDELPQLINVLRGDMSLVGPRPPLLEEVSRYERKQRRRLSMRPGLTCTWQVSGRNEIPDFAEWARLDLEYIDNWSLWNDFKLLVRTIPAVLGGTGAR